MSTDSTENEFDVVIIGLGAMGSAALYHLSETRMKVAGIDQFKPPHQLGSSHGETRITRLSVGEGHHYVDLVKRSHQLWQDLEKKSGHRLYHPCGGLIYGKAENAAGIHGQESFLKQTIAIANEFSIDHQVLDEGLLRQRFPQFKYSKDDIGYYEPQAGFVYPERIIKTHLDLAEDNSATCFFDQKVLSIEPGSSAVTVATDRMKIRAQKVVLSAGAWLHKLLPMSFHDSFKVYRQVLYWFACQESSAFKGKDSPVYIHFGRKDEGLFYGFPPVKDGVGGVKVATEVYEQTCSPDSIDRNVTKEEKNWALDYFPKYLDVQKKLLKEAVCMYTVTASFEFVIDRLPEDQRILLVSACSGHGFKHSAAIGEWVRQMVEDETISFPHEHFKIGAF